MISPSVVPAEIRVVTAIEQTGRVEEGMMRPDWLELITIYEVGYGSELVNESAARQDTYVSKTRRIADRTCVISSPPCVSPMVLAILAIQETFAFFWEDSRSVFLSLILLPCPDGLSDCASSTDTPYETGLWVLRHQKPDPNTTRKEETQPFPLSCRS